jgi:transcriptional regulator with XRE-family HTH domain
MTMKKARKANPSKQSREQRILELRCQGLTQMEISRRLGVSRYVVYCTLKDRQDRLGARCCQCQAEIDSDLSSPPVDGMLCPQCYERWWGSVPVGRVLHNLRTAQGQTVTHLALQAGISEGDLRSYESGLKQPSPDVANRLLRALRSPVKGKR